MKKSGLGSVLILGGGGCSLPHSLVAAYPGMRIDVLEKSGKFIQIAGKYFLDKKDLSQVKLIQENAYQFVKQKVNHARYDLIVVDLFDGQAIPSGSYSHKFIEDLSKCLKNKNSLLITNFALNLVSDSRELISVYKKNLKTIFILYF